MAIVAVALLSAESATAELPLPGVSGLPPVPTVTVPNVLDPVLEVVPTLPSVPRLPDVSLPAVPGLPTVPDVTSDPNAPALPNAPAVPVRRPGTSQGGAATGGSAPAGGPSSGGSGATSGGGSAGDTPGGGRRAGSGSPASRKRSAVRRVRRERRLRKTVRRLQGCFGGLSRLERRVLVLRAGIGAGPARTRTQVARRLDVSTRRVTRLERHGVRTLRRLAGAGRCVGGAAQPTAGAPFGEPRMAAALQGPWGPIGSGSAADAIDVKGERQSSGDGQGSGDAAGPATLEQRVPAPARVRLLGLDLTVPLFIALGLAALWFVVRAVRRTLGSEPLG